MDRGRVRRVERGVLEVVYGGVDVVYVVGGVDVISEWVWCGCVCVCGDDM